MAGTSVRLKGETAVVDVDEVASAAVMMDVMHRRIHEGRCFTSSSVDLSVGTLVDLKCLLRVPANVVAHVQSFVGSNRTVQTQFYVAPTVTDDGTALSRVNRNLASSNVSQMLVFIGPTTSDFGTLLIDRVVPAGVFGVTGPVANVGFSEFVLTANDYLIRMVNQAADTGRLSVLVDWYE